jgi:hypothetical protein
MARIVDLGEHKKELENDLFTEVPILNSTLEKLDKTAERVGKGRIELLNNLICSFHNYFIEDKEKEENKLKEVKN